MNSSFVLLIILSGLTVWDSGALKILSTYSIPSLPIIGSVSIWTIIAVYLGTVIDIEVGTFILRKVSKRKKEEVSL